MSNSGKQQYFKITIKLKTLIKIQKMYIVINLFFIIPIENSKKKTLEL